MSNKYGRVKLVIKLGGSLVSVDQGSIDKEFLMRFSKFIRELSKEIPAIFIIVGGGKIVRNYQKAAMDLGVTRPDDIDSIGWRLTRVNGELVRSVIGRDCAGEILYTGQDFKWFSRVVVGAGWGNAVTSDYNAVMAADTIGHYEVVRLSNIDHIYTANPNEDPDAKKIENMTWEQLQQINQLSNNEKYSPGMKVPFDPKAVALAKKLKMKMAFIHGHKLEEIQKYLLGKKFTGTFVADELKSDHLKMQKDTISS